MLGRHHAFDVIAGMVVGYALALSVISLEMA